MPRVFVVKWIPFWLFTWTYTIPLLWAFIQWMLLHVDIIKLINISKLIFFLNQWMQVFVFGMLGGVDLPLTTCVFCIRYHIEQLACGDELYRFNQVNIMAADARVPCFTKPSAAMILVRWYGQVLVGRALGRIPTTSLPIPCKWGGMIEIVTTCLCRCLKIARKELIQLTKLYNYDQSSCLFHSTWVSSAP